MMKKGLQSARDSFETIERSIAALEVAKDFKEFSTAWSNFLISISRLFSKLEEGSKDNNKSIAWFADIKHERKTDPLIRYLRVARNADHHGLTEVAKQEGDKLILKGDFLITRARIGGPNSFIRGRQAGPTPPSFEITPNIVLTAVTDKRETQSPPLSHKGVNLADPESPIEVAYLARDFLAGTLEEAAKLPEGI